MNYRQHAQIFPPA